MIDVTGHPNRLRALREEADLPRRDVAVELDVTEETIRRFEENRGGPIPSRYIPTLTAFLTRALGRHIGGDHLMGWDHDPGRPDQLALDEPVPAGTGGVV
jgi:DNA-binding XRE family transcriptional regulator